MTRKVYVYDPTKSDELSRVRGVGRYLQILRENFKDDFIFTSDLNKIPRDATFINPFFNFLQPPLLKHRISQRQIAVVHDLILLQFPRHFPVGIRGWINIFLNKHALKNYDYIITDSAASKTTIQKKLKTASNKIRIAYPCLPTIFTQEEKIKGSKKNLQLSTKEKHAVLARYGIADVGVWNYFIYVGDVTWNKNLVIIAKAIIKANSPCIFVGKAFGKNDKLNHPWNKELREFQKIVKGDNRFVFPGFVPDEDLVLLYKYAVGNLLVSREEGFGFSYHEAASQKIPSILSNIPVFRELANDSAIYVNPDSDDHLSEAIQSLHISEATRKKLGDKAYRQIRKFSAQSFRESFLKAVTGD